MKHIVTLVVLSTLSLQAPALGYIDLARDTCIMMVAGGVMQGASERKIPITLEQAVGVMNDRLSEDAEIQSALETCTQDVIKHYNLSP
ncbi:MAG: hypothetical protein ACREBU_15375, partial [Nitrososphaera sp.]